MLTTLVQLWHCWLVCHLFVGSNASICLSNNLVLILNFPKGLALILMIRGSSCCMRMNYSIWTHTTRAQTKALARFIVSKSLVTGCLTKLIEELLCYTQRCQRSTLRFLSSVALIHARFHQILTLQQSSAEVYLYGSHKSSFFVCCIMLF